ncbi:MAG: aminotransferase class I/II-fold pyridoxal phosphate-dependent enzyme, partial [Lachnospiraceae bacterium]|nr:aminotransferase class I/II-fold pyridoxal phosphate-dependent enzyme [Lachnospiraceae bacterium]
MPERNLDFDKVIERRGTDSLKYDFAKQRHMPEDVLPLWVADMDFKTTSYVEDAIVRRAIHGIYGYSEPGCSYFEAVHDWILSHHGWDVKESWLIKTPGVVFALAMCVKAFTEPGDGILLQLPVYYPFSEVIEDNGRRVISNDLVLGGDNRYHIDIEDFENKVKNEKIKLFFLCNPHNPVGRVWSIDELKTIGDICVRYGV